MNTFNLFRQIDKELEEKIGLSVSDYSLSYDVDGEERENSIDIGANSVQAISDIDSGWTADSDNLIIKQTVNIENSTYLFGPSGVTLANNKLGIGLHIYSRTSMFQETVSRAEIKNTDRPQSLEIIYSFPKDQLRGKVCIETFFYVKELNEYYPVHADLQGMRVSQRNISELVLIIDGDGSTFPIGEFEDEDGPLWKLEFSDFDASEDTFSYDNIRVLLNTSHRLFKQLKQQKTSLSRALMMEIISQAMTIIINRVFNDGMISDSEIDISEGTILSTVDYWISAFEVDTSDLRHISNSLKLKLEQSLLEE